MSPAPGLLRPGAIEDRASVGGATEGVGQDWELTTPAAWGGGGEAEGGQRQDLEVQGVQSSRVPVGKVISTFSYYQFFQAPE